MTTMLVDCSLLQLWPFLCLLLLLLLLTSTLYGHSSLYCSLACFLVCLSLTTAAAATTINTWAPFCIKYPFDIIAIIIALFTFTRLYCSLSLVRLWQQQKVILLFFSFSFFFLLLVLLPPLLIIPLRGASVYADHQKRTLVAAEWGDNKETMAV